MPRRSEKVLSNKKTNKSSILQADRAIQLNRNASDQTETDITSRIESIGNLIINELKGSERDRLKQQLQNSSVSNTTTMSNLLFSSSRKSLKQVLAELHTHTEREYRTIGIGDNDVNANITNTNMINDKSEIATVPKRETRRTNFVNSFQTIDNGKKKTPNIITRTICTRSSKLNTLNNNQEEINHVHLNRARKRRSSLINNTNTHTQINNVDNSTEKLLGEDVSDVKVSRKKLQSSVPCSTTVECLKTTNDI